MSHIWNILGIKSTNDKREIKKAYAIKLRITKPDEDPAAFQTLYSAYQEALQLATYHAAVVDEICMDEQDTKEDVKQDTSNDDDSWEAPYNEWQSDSDPVPVATYEFDYAAQLEENQQEIERLLSVVDGLLRNPERNRLELWQDIINSPYILDESFFESYSHAVLQRILIYYNDLEYDKFPGTRLKPNILKHLYQVLDWYTYDYEVLYENIEDPYGQVIFNTVFKNKLEGKTDDQKAIASVRGGKRVTHSVSYKGNLSEQQYAHWFARSMAMVIDLVLVAAITIGVIAVGELTLGVRALSGDTVLLSIILTIFLSWQWLFESSAKQATPGKRVVGIRVCNVYLEKMGYFQGLFRTLLFTLFFALLLVLIFELTALGLWLGIVYVILSKRHLHDRLSGTYVTTV